MLKKTLGMITVGVAIALFVTLPFPIATSAQNFNQIYVFGDSLSDVGNVYKATNKESPPSPPYFQGRYSDGPVWVEYLASKLRLTSNTSNNFAFGGAKTGNSQALPPGVLAQIQRFKATRSSAEPNALYIIWAGANDYLGGATDTTVPINNLASAVKSLAAVGAKNIVVANLPDLGKLPGTRTTQRSSSLSNLTKKHNTGLAASLNSLRQKLGSNINIIYIDVNSQFERVFNTPEKSGFKNVNQPCLNQGIICPRPNEYLFWDSIHPSTAAHKLLVEFALPGLKFTSEPPPVSVSEFAVPLSIFIFAALGVGLIILRRRKAIRDR